MEEYISIGDYFINILALVTAIIGLITAKIWMVIAKLNIKKMFPVESS